MLNLFKGMVRRNRVTIVTGTENYRELYDIACVIRMVRESDKLDYLPTGEETSVHMFGYKATDDEQEVIKMLLKTQHPNVSFTYLIKK